MLVPPEDRLWRVTERWKTDQNKILQIAEATKADLTPFSIEYLGIIIAIYLLFFILQLSSADTFHFARFACPFMLCIFAGMHSFNQMWFHVHFTGRTI